MTVLDQTLKAIASLSDRPFDEVLTYHLLEGILRRVAASNHASDLVLRGSMMTRLWVPLGHRVAVDVDFLGMYPFEVEATEQRFRELLAVDRFTDSVVFHLDSLEAKGIWLDDPFPGVRLCLQASVERHQQQIQIDVGFSDPLVPPAQWIEYPTLVAATSVQLQGVRPETMAAWKLHGLIEHGAKRWRAKDLYDLMLLATVVPLDESLLPEAIRIAFSSRNADLRDVQRILTNLQWWDTGKNHRNWRWYCRKAPTQLMPEDYLSVVTPVVGYWGSLIDGLCQ